MMFGSVVKTSRVIRHSCIKIAPRQPFSAKSNNSSSHSSAIKHVEEANNKSESVTAASTIKDTALSKINNLASQATQLAKSKATNAVTHASNTIRTSLHNTKVNAKIKTEQYAWEAHRSLNKARTEMGTKIKNKANQTREQIQQSVKEELSKRMPQFGGSKSSNSVQAQTKSSATAAQTEPTILKNSIPSDKPKQSSMPSSISSLLPSKETILSSATTTALSNAATETLNRTTSNLSTQFTSTIHKAFKWLWWWGLAAVGVYGISTTLTKEGVALLKDVVVGGTASTSSDEKKSPSLSSTSSSVSKDDEVIQAAAVVVESDYVNDGFEVASENSGNKQQDPPNQERWSSWLSSWRKGSK